MYSQQASTVLPPRLLRPRQPHTPVVAMHTSPAETAASALTGLSVTHSGGPGSASLLRICGGTSSTGRVLAGVSYLTGLPSRDRGLSGRYWWYATPPCTSWT